MARTYQEVVEEHFRMGNQAQELAEKQRHYRNAEAWIKKWNQQFPNSVKAQQWQKRTAPIFRFYAGSPKKQVTNELVGQTNIPPAATLPTNVEAAGAGGRRGLIESIKGLFSGKEQEEAQ